jgi:hypothetical protein
MKDAARGCGQLVSGGYSSQKAEWVDAAHKSANGKVKGANVVSRKFNGGFVRFNKSREKAD